MLEMVEARSAAEAELVLASWMVSDERSIRWFGWRGVG